MSGHAWATEDTRSNKSGKNSWPHHAYILAQRRAMKKKKKEGEELQQPEAMQCLPTSRGHSYLA